MKKFIFILFFNVCFSQIDVNIVNVATNDLVYDSVTDRIYVTIPSSNGSNGNSIGIINPNTYTLDNTIFIGSEPSVMAISNDGQFIYTGFVSSSTYRKFIVATQTASNQFPLGADNHLGPYYVEDIEVIPNQPNSVAISRKHLGVSPRFAGVAIYDEGIARPNISDWHGAGEISTHIEFKSSSQLLGYDNETTAYSFNNLVVNSSGVSLVSGSSISPPGGFISNADFAYGNNYCYFPNGMIIDVSSTPYVSGSFSNVYGAVAYDDENNLVCFGTSTSGNIFFQRFNAETFLSYSSLLITQAFGEVKKLIYCGSGVYAMNTTDDKVVIIKDSNLSSNNNILNNNIKIYPNPVNDVLNISEDNNSLEKVIVYDVIGKKVIEVSYQNSIDTSALKAGLYVIKFVDKNNEIFSNKFLKK